MERAREQGKVLGPPRKFTGGRVEEMRRMREECAGPGRLAADFECSPNNFAAYAPDLPGCVATGTTREELLVEIREAIEFHIESLREHGEPVPEPQTTAEVVDAGAVAAE